MNGDEISTETRLVKPPNGRALKRHFADAILMSDFVATPTASRLVASRRSDSHVAANVGCVAANAKVRRERSRSPEPPYCWQSKDALRQIESTYDSESSTRIACAAYLALTRIASDKGAESFECSVKDIAGYMHYRYNQTLKGIQLAEAAGVIKVERRKVPGTAENAPSVYMLLGVIGKTDKVIQKINKVIDSSRFTSNAESIERTEKEQRSNREHSLAQPTAGAGERSEATSDPFEEFWAAYPKKRGKLAAKKAWQARKPPLPKVLETLAAFKVSPEWRKDNGRFIPYPASWLTRGGWEDELPTKTNDETPVQASALPDRSLVNPEAFRAYLHEHYREEFQRQWTPQNAPPRVVQDFLNNKT
jgi:hypothetical protein